MVTTQHGTKMKINEIDDNVIQGPWKKKEPAKKIPVHRAFGGPEYADLVDAGVRFIEKPSSLSYIDRGGPDGDRHVSSKDLKNVEEKIGRKLQSYNAYDILKIQLPHYDHPQVDADFSKTKGEETFILWFPSNPKIDDWFKIRNAYPSIIANSRYLVNRTGASKYIRMWVALID